MPGNARRNTPGEERGARPRVGRVLRRATLWRALIRWREETGATQSRGETMRCRAPRRSAREVRQARPFRRVKMILERRDGRCARRAAASARGGDWSACGDSRKETGTGVSKERGDAREGRRGDTPEWGSLARANESRNQRVARRGAVRGGDAQEETGAAPGEKRGDTLRGQGRYA